MALICVCVNSSRSTEDPKRTERRPENDWTLPLPEPECPSPVLGYQTSTTVLLFQITDGKSRGFLPPIIARVSCLCKSTDWPVSPRSLSSRGGQPWNRRSGSSLETMRINHSAQLWRSWGYWEGETNTQKEARWREGRKLFQNNKNVVIMKSIIWVPTDFWLNQFYRMFKVIIT